MFMYAIACAFRWGVALVGEFFYWASLTPSWDPLSGIGGVQGDGAPTRPGLRRRATCDLDNTFIESILCKKNCN